MATIALSLAGQAVGAAIGGPIGATIGRALGALAGNAIDQRLFAPEAPARGGDIRLQSSSEGVGIARLYGWARLSGNVIWANELELLDAGGAGAKGFSRGDGEEVVAASFAVGFCEGEVAHLGRIWADGQLLDTRNLTLRFYPGSETQEPDSLIEAKQGDAPAYRGLCYLVFERLPLTDFGNRIPQISVELCRVVGELEPSIRAVCVIPGATEYGYDPAPRMRLLGLGASAPENIHQREGASDWDVSIDELTALCPNLEHVALVVAWFGDDLRCGECRIEPKVMDRDRTISGASWKVGGIAREDASEVSEAVGGPAYGGTPSDAAVLAAIADLKSRGLSVTLYPFVMMDVPAGNDLPNPYGGVGQPAYPWRGRITCDPAPGIEGTADMSAAAGTQVAAFMGEAEPGDFSAGSGTVNFSGGAEFSYRRFILHYAHLAEIAGGVETFLIGSELRGLTTLRTDARDFPFVDALCALAEDVRGIVGAGTKITYAADWSEYHGLQPPDAPGDKLFHLDALWAHEAIDAVGIDNYMPAADWRDGAAHLDRALSDDLRDLDYLAANFSAGEGYDWYYASAHNRDHQIRTPITDSVHGEPFVWRFKDIEGWWGNAHHHRVDGVRDASPTEWAPGSKPIWLTELGCGAVRHGANQPNAFADPKSSEDARPYHSDGTSDAAMQRAYLIAQHRFWAEAAHNPAATEYDGRMLDAERLYLWAWDARPFPAFPQLSAEWADASAHATGHWLNGRLGALSADELAAAVLADHGVAMSGRRFVAPLFDGAVVARPMTARAALEPVMAATELRLLSQPEGIFAERLGARAATEIEDVVKADGPALLRRHGDAHDAPRELTLAYDDRLGEYQSGSALARISTDEGQALAEGADWILEPNAAGELARGLLASRLDGAETISLTLPLSHLALEPGDVLALDDGARFAIEAVREGETLAVEARRLSERPELSIILEGARGGGAVIEGAAAPVVLAALLPPVDASESAARLVLAAQARPWPGYVSLFDQAQGETLAILERPAAVGEFLTPLADGPVGFWDRQSIEIELAGGHVASIAELPVFGGANRLIAQHDDGAWEVIGFREAELIGTARYRLKGLLRGLEKTEYAMEAPLSEGARFILRRAGEKAIDFPRERLGGDLTLTAFAGPADAVGTAFVAVTRIDVLAMLSPAHLRAVREGDDIALSWVRRTRAGGNDWSGVDVPLDAASENYRVTIFDGETALRVIEVSAAAATYTEVQQADDFGGPAEIFAFSVVQMSASLGAGHAARGTFTA